jgi:hypothetical protein
MKCGYCGQENPEGELFCSNCGMKLEGGPPAPAAPPLPTGEPVEQIEEAEHIEPTEPVKHVEPATGKPGVRCENCGMMNPEGASVCAGCNQPLKKVPGVCPHCGFDKNPDNAKFCMSCGMQLSIEDEETSPLQPEMPEVKLVLPNKREILLCEPETIIGRGDFLQEVSTKEAKYISREHLTIFFEDKKFYILDENSTNGTKLNGVEIKGSGKKELKNNDRIVLADTINVTFNM